MNIFPWLFELTVRRAGRSEIFISFCSRMVSPANILFFGLAYSFNVCFGIPIVPVEPRSIYNVTELVCGLIKLSELFGSSSTVNLGGYSKLYLVHIFSDV